MNRAAAQDARRATRRAPSPTRRGSRRGPRWRGCRRRPARTGSRRSRRRPNRSSGRRRPARPRRWRAPSRACRGSGRRSGRAGCRPSTASPVSAATWPGHADADRVAEADLVDAELEQAQRDLDRAEPARPARCTGSRTRSRRSARRHQPSSPARSRTGAKAASDASTVIPMLRVVNASRRRGEDRDRVGAGRLRAGQAALVRDEDRVAHAGSPRRARPGASSASASCGMALGATKLVASISRSPASARSSMKRGLGLASGSRAASFWRPSRGPTS